MTREDAEESHSFEKASKGDEAREALTPQALRALQEAKERRAAQPTAASEEIGGRGGLEPTRYGDWEKKGIACDF